MLKRTQINSKCLHLFINDLRLNFSQFFSVIFSFYISTVTVTSTRVRSLSTHSCEVTGRSPEVPQCVTTFTDSVGAPDWFRDSFIRYNISDTPFLLVIISPRKFHTPGKTESPESLQLSETENHQPSVFTVKRVERTVPCSWCKPSFHTRALFPRLLENRTRGRSYLVLTLERERTVGLRRH